MSKVMLYITFFAAVAGMLVCMYQLFTFFGDGVQEYINLFLFVMFTAIAMICAVIERDIKNENSSNQ